jgi:outer membrane protein TolC
VGSIIELLGAQAALSSAQNQWQQAKIARASAQIGLAVTAGRLGTSKPR